VYGLAPSQFPADFPVRLAAFRDAADLTWRELARLLSINVRSVHRWRAGTRPDAGHLLALLGLAAERGLLHLLLPVASVSNDTTHSTATSGASSRSNGSPELDQQGELNERAG